MDPRYRSTPGKNGLGHSSPLPKSASFHKTLIYSNQLGRTGFKEWVFDPGMLFSATSKWWAGKGERPAPHEGLDLYAHRNDDMRVHHVSPGMKYPAMFPGKVVSICSDFLGKSIFVRHDQYVDGARSLFTAYGHGIPLSGIQLGAVVGEVDSIAVVADSSRKNAAAPPHLHLSAGWIRESLLDNLTWDSIAGSAEVDLIDPLDILTLPYSVESLDDTPVL